MLAYFGWPEAHEDAAEQAVRAGLAVGRSVAKVRTAEPALPVLILATTRLELQPPWPDDDRTKTLVLSRFDRQQSAVLIQQLTGSKRLPEVLEAEILAKTEGVPLFLEELTKTVLEAGWLADVGDRYKLTRPLPTLDVPATLQDSLMARLDRLAASNA